MKKLLLNRKPINGPWGGGNLFVQAICENAENSGYEIVHDFKSKVDAILMVDPRYDELGISSKEICDYKLKNPEVRVVHRVNECDARKGTNDMDNMLRECSKFTDATIFVSKWIQNYFKDNWNTKEQHVVYNGVNHDHFRHKDYEISEKVQRWHDGEGEGLELHEWLGMSWEDYKEWASPTRKKITKIVSHHWSNNPRKGFDIYEKLDEWVGKNPDFSFTYIGRERGTFKNTTVIEPLFGKALGDELRQYDVYVSASRFDPGPNHIIEALACELPTFVHKDGGGACEFCNSNSQYSSFEELVLRLKMKEWPPSYVWPFFWDMTAANCFDIIDKKLYMYNKVRSEW